MKRFYSHYEKISLFLEHEISKSKEILRRKTSKSEIFSAHPPFPCIRHQHAVNLKLYRSHRRTELRFLNQDWSQDYSASCPPPLGRCTHWQDAATQARRFLEVSVCVCARLTTAPCLHAPKLLSEREGIIFSYTVNKSFQDMGGLVLKI